MTSALLPIAWSWPSAGGWGVLVLLGVLGGAGHGLMVLAFARAPVSLLAPMSYTQMIWAVLAGMLVFADFPDLLTLVGHGRDRHRRAAGGAARPCPQGTP